MTQKRWSSPLWLWCTPGFIRKDWIERQCVTQVNDMAEASIRVWTISEEDILRFPVLRTHNSKWFDSPPLQHTYCTVRYQYCTLDTTSSKDVSHLKTDVGSWWLCHYFWRQHSLSCVVGYIVQLQMTRLCFFWHICVFDTSPFFWYVHAFVDNITMEFAISSDESIGKAVSQLRNCHPLQ